MKDDLITEMMHALVRHPADAPARRELLHRAGLSLLDHPALGAQLVARICATDADAPELEALADLLGAALDTARMASEGGAQRGARFLAAATDAVALASAQDRLTPFHRLLLASTWMRNGLAAPEGLELTEADLEGQDVPADVEGLDPEAAIEELFDSLIAQTDGDAFAIHMALSESLPAMPTLMRAHVIRAAALREGPIHAQLACFFLLDRDAANRESAAQALANRAKDGRLPAELAAQIVTLRNWMPDDAARALIDTAIKASMRAGLDQAQPATSWSIEAVLASLPDGGGAQSIAIALKQGRRRKVAMLLLKQGHGVKDAYVIPCRTARDQKAMLDEVESEARAYPVSADWLPGTLAHALADGLAAGLPPAAGLIEIAQLCKLGQLRPADEGVEARLNALPDTARLRGLSAQARGRLVKASAGWWERHEILDSWFEESDGAQAALEGARSERAAKAALWQWLETRRPYWTQMITRAAELLAAAGDPDADSFIATALALIEGREMRKIPAMQLVHEATIDVWAMRADDATDEASPIPQAPRPERKGELTRLLKDAPISADWLDGFLMSVTLAPKPITPERWLQEVIEQAIMGLSEATIQRFVELALHRANACLDQAEDEAEFRAKMSQRSDAALRDWAAGFSHGCKRFKSAWPAKSTRKDDRAMIQQLAAASSRGMDAAELATLSTWVAARLSQNASA